MKMLLHELHPAVVHAPLTLLPTATAADLISVLSGDPAWARVGRRLWVVGTASALFSGLAGLAASQEVKLEQPRARDMVFLHGLGNACITAGAIGVTLWRLRNPPTLGQGLIGLMATAAALYTGALGGKLVYELGVGVNSMPPDASVGTLKGQPLLSRAAPAALLRDAFTGLRWLLGRARSLLKGAHPLAPGAKGFGPSHELPPSVPSELLAYEAEVPRPRP
ncbi:MAG: DUF2231 domain-containing protein [Myxococcaceae bacterium]|nr:DUF2231 domain-containing protein [Myxococcaceae bacterium]